jgi:hypothetical protein
LEGGIEGPREPKGRGKRELMGVEVVTINSKLVGGVPGEWEGRIGGEDKRKEGEKGGEIFFREGN